MEISLGIVVADVSYWLGHIRDSRGDPIHSILVRRGMHTVGLLLSMVAWIVAAISCC